MGGTKKRPLAAMEKSQTGEEDAAKAAKKSKDAKPMGERKKIDVLVPRMSDQELMKPLSSLKAITLYSAARGLGVNASVARVVLASLESKGLLTKVGGFSGHYVWAPSK